MPTRRQCANAIRALAIDAIEKSRSGHPGAPLGMADMAEASGATASNTIPPIPVDGS